MGGRGGFTLLELLVAISIFSILLSTFPAINRATKQLLLRPQTALTVTEIREAQATAVASGENSVWAPTPLPAGLAFTPGRYFTFSGSGFTPPGGSGTLALACGKNTRKIIVSSYGRIRIE